MLDTELALRSLIALFIGVVFGCIVGLLVKRRKPKTAMTLMYLFLAALFLFMVYPLLVMLWESL